MNKVTENKAKQKLLLELLIIFAFCIAIFIFSAHYDILEKLVKFSLLHENWELDEIITVSFFLVFAFAVFSMRRLEELRKTLSEIKQLRGIIPICSACKKIRDDEGIWHQIESYVRNHSEAQFSHGICPECMKKLYPDLEDEIKQEDEPS